MKHRQRNLNYRLSTEMPETVSKTMSFFLVSKTSKNYQNDVRSARALHRFVLNFWQRFYINASRQMKRIDSILRSPIYSHFGATIAGAASIRSYREQDRFVRINEKNVDQNQMAYFANTISNR